MRLYIVANFSFDLAGINTFLNREKNGFGVLTVQKNIRPDISSSSRYN